MKKLITDIQGRLMAAVPTLKYVDLDWGQLDFYYPNPPVQWPCALIDIMQAGYSNAAHRTQLGLLQVAINIADLKLSNSSGKAPQNQKDNALKIYDLMKDVFVALQGWTGDKSYTGLIRERYSKRSREDGITIHQLVFSTEIKDNAAMPVIDTTPASVVFKVQKL